jgi:hypothetical protein
MNSQSEIFFVPLQLVITTDTLCCNVFLSQLLIRNNFSLYELTYKCVFPWRTKFQVQVSVAYKRNSPISPVSGLKTLDIQVCYCQAPDDVFSDDTIRAVICADEDTFRSSRSDIKDQFIQVIKIRKLYKGKESEI